MTLMQESNGYPPRTTNAGDKPMPLPTPQAGEARADFLSRCLADPATQEMQGTNEQKVAACERQFDDAKKDASPEADVPSDGFGSIIGFGMKAANAEIIQGHEGKVRAIVATFDEIDNDGDVILSGAIPDGMKVTGSFYNHDTVFHRMQGIAQPDAPPVAKGAIRIEGKHAVAYLDYFMETQRGSEAFKTVKAMGADGRWSFAYHYDEPPTRATGDWAKKGARRTISKLGPLMDGSMEVSPVKMPGGATTGTLSAKGATPKASVDGVEHPAEDFAHVPDPAKPSTWQLPIFDAAHVRNALARLDQTQIPVADLPAVKRKIQAAAEKFGVDASSLEPAKKSAEDVTTELRRKRTLDMIKDRG